MAKPNLDTTEIRKLMAEFDCHDHTIRKVYKNDSPAGYPISRKIYEALIRDGYLDRK